MSINFNLYTADGLRQSAKRMNIANLEVGQTVIRLFRPTNSWGRTIGEFKTAEYKVAKVLKTRLVLESADQNAGVEIRLVVENSRYSMRNGDVTTDREGTKGSWSREEYEFVTEDEQDLVEELRERYNKQAQKQADQDAAKNAVAEVRQALDGTPDLEKVEAAIQALQVIADGLRADKR